MTSGVATGWQGIVRTLHELGCSPREIGAAVMALDRGETASGALEAMRAAAAAERGFYEELKRELETGVPEARPTAGARRG